MKRIIHTVLKMTIASILATLIAQAFQLEGAITAGILAVLSIQLTRTDSFNLAFSRLSSSVIAIVLSLIFFTLLGYELWVFFLFTLPFITIAFTLKLSAGIVPALVLVSQLLNHQQFEFTFTLAVFALMLIAVMVALLINIIYPTNTKKALMVYSESLDDILKSMLDNIGTFLLHTGTLETLNAAHESLSSNWFDTIEEAQLIEKDLYFNKNIIAADYIHMRKKQKDRIDTLINLANNLKKKHPYSKAIGSYIMALTYDIGKANKATLQQETLHTLLNHYRNKPLPSTREAFETRAVLYQMMFELDGILNAKLAFHQTH